MRVIAGSARGVPLKTVPDFDTRPILDRLKKSLFSILDSAGLLHESRVMDLYAGTGIQGIEALSRGARYCLFVERRSDAAVLLRENLKKARLDERAEVQVTTVTRQLKRLSGRASHALNAGFDLVLYDPPFEDSREGAHRARIENEMHLAGGLLRDEGRLVLRTEKRTEPPEPDGLKLVRRWTVGKHALCFYLRA
jgi:16S rRNA (guanine966-N2)-methyltransferase